MRVSKGGCDTDPSLEAAPTGSPSAANGMCSVFTFIFEQNTDSLKSTLCRHINNELFKILCMLLEKVMQLREEDWIMSGEWQLG